MDKPTCFVVLTRFGHSKVHGCLTHQQADRIMEHGRVRGLEHVECYTSAGLRTHFPELEVPTEVSEFLRDDEADGYGRHRGTSLP